MNVAGSEKKNNGKWRPEVTSFGSIRCFFFFDPETYIFESGNAILRDGLQAIEVYWMTTSHLLQVFDVSWPAKCYLQ